MMKLFKSCRMCIWRFVRLTLLWSIFGLCAYWYSERAIPQQRQQSRFIQYNNDRRKVFLEPGETPLTSNFVFNDLDKDNNTEYNSYREESKTNNGNRQKEIFFNEHADTKEELSTTIKKHATISALIGDNSDDTNKNIFIELKGKDLEHYQEDYSKAKNDRFFDNGDDLIDGSSTDESSDNTDVKTPPSALLTSAQRSLVPNQLVLKAGRLHWTIAMAGAYSEKLFSPPPNEMPQQRLPQAIIIGFGKCGTRALIDFLSMHPNIVTTGPEIHFFDVDDNFSKGLVWYQSQMPLSYSNQITVEKTPSYIWSERAMEEIYKLNKQIKLIVILKDPVSRIVSQALRSGQDTESMCMVMKDGSLQVNNDSRTVQWSMYVKYLQIWMKKFPKSQIHVVETSEFARHPAKELQKIEAFLGVPHLITEKNFYFNETKGFYCKRPLHVQEIACLPEGKGRPHPQLTPVVKKKIYEFFRGYNEDLFRLLGRRFQWEPPEF